MTVQEDSEDPKIELKNIIGCRVREARKAFQGGLTQDHLSGRLAALKITIDRAGIAKIELGIRHVYDFEVAALARALRVDVKWLLGIETTGGPDKIVRRTE
ncbi:helix-turn-helix domain-containing protein [Haloferula sp.]|uniref:helix-turn-helix domain-containing protein n=1 Tax=Haloferula sp. TaxID=2497595 RepID=UPI003C73682C